MKKLIISIKLILLAFLSKGQFAQPVVTVATMNDLMTGYTGTYSQVRVLDSLSGGTFQVYISNVSLMEDLLAVNIPIDSGVIVPVAPIAGTTNIRYAIRDISQTDGVNAAWWGANPVNEDNHVFFQRAINYAYARGGGWVNVGKGAYRDTLPFFMYWGVSLRGQGIDSSAIINTRTVSNIPPNNEDMFCFMMGNFLAGTYTRAVHYNALDTLKVGTNRIKMNPTDLVNITLGKPILLQNDSGFVGHGGFFTAYWSRITIADSIVDDSILIVRDAFDQNVPIATVAVTDQFTSGGDTDPLGVPYYIGGYSTISNINFISHDYVTRRMGCYRCTFDHVKFKGTKGIGGNGLAYFQAYNSYFFYSAKAIETARFSHDYNIHDCTFSWSPGVPDDDIVRGVIKLGENSANGKVHDCIFNGGDQASTYEGIKFDHSFNLEYYNNIHHFENARQRLIDITPSDDSARIEGLKVHNNIFIAGSDISHFIDLQPDSALIGISIAYNDFANNTFMGTPGANAAIIVSGQHNRFFNNTYENGGLNTDTASHDNIVIGDKFYNGSVIDDSGVVYNAFFMDGVETNSLKPVLYTPTGTTDDTYPPGTIAADGDYIYFRKNNGDWVKTALIPL